MKFTQLSLAGKYEEAREYASPESSADRYAIHMDGLTDAMAAAGHPSLDNGAPTADPAAGTITFSQGEGVEDTVWSDFTYDADSKVTGWSLGSAGTPLSDRMWTKGAEASVNGVTVKLISAYENEFGLWVVLDVFTETSALSVDYSPSLTDTDRRQRNPANVVGPDTIDPETSGYVVYSFEGASFGGTLTYTLLSTGYSELGQVKIVVE